MDKPYKPSIMEKTLTIECRQGAVRAVRFNNDGNYCLTCGSDKSLKLWNPHRNLLLKAYAGHGYEVLDAQASSDNGQIASCSADKTVMLWDVGTGQVVRRYRGHAAKVNCVRFNEESTIMMSGSVDNTVRAWDCRSRSLEPVHVLDEAKDVISSIDVSSHEILTGSIDHRVRVYDIRKGQLTEDNLASPIACATFTKDGQCSLCSCLDSTIRLMDKDTGEMLNEFTGHRNRDYRIDNCLSSKDTHVLSGSEDGNVYVWDLVEAKQVAVLPHPGKTVTSLSYHPSEDILLTACSGDVLVWKNVEHGNDS